MKKKRSLRYIVSLMLTSLILLMAGTIFIYSLNLSAEITEKQMHNLSPVLQAMGNTLEREMDQAERYLADISTNSAVFRNLGSEADMTQSYKAADEIRATFAPILSANKSISCIAVYSARTGVYHGAYGTLSGDTGTDRVRLKSMIQEELIARINEETLDLSGWSIIGIDENYFLCRIVNWQSVFCVCLVDLTQVASDLAVRYELNGEMAILRDGTLLTPLHYEVDNAVWNSPEGVVTCVRGLHPLWILKSDMGVAELACVVPQSEMMGGGVLQILLILLAGLVFLGLLLTYRFLKKGFIRPMNTLMDSMERIRAGDLNAQPSEQYASEEFSEVIITFNKMIEAIKQAKIETYEKSLESERAQLSTLKMQIRPHFYLNCLKSIYAFASLGRMEEVREKILYLSRHLRYVFTEFEDTVPLQRELELCRNYVSMENIGQAFPITFAAEVEPELMDLKIPPITLLSLVENSVKYRSGPDSPLEIRITAHMLAAAEGRLINLVVRDNGTGFSEEALRLLNEPKPEHVGIANMTRRFKFVFGDDCAVAFSNQEGAQTDIFVVLGEGTE